MSMDTCTHLSFPRKAMLSDYTFDILNFIFFLNGGGVFPFFSVFEEPQLVLEHSMNRISGPGKTDTIAAC